MTEFAAPAGPAEATGPAGPTQATVPAEATEPAGLGPVTGPDGIVRCPWGIADETYRRYHDTEWGVPVRGETALFERLALEAFQSGLSWITVLRKRPAFRAAFAGFDPAMVAGFGADEVERLLADPGIIRNRAKVTATIANAQVVLGLDQPLDELLWSFAPAARPAPVTTSDVPASTAESTAMARRLKSLGFRFVGPTTCYALMQATGMVDDHLAGCCVRRTA